MSRDEIKSLEEIMQSKQTLDDLDYYETNLMIAYRRLREEERASGCRIVKNLAMQWIEDEESLETIDLRRGKSRTNRRN